MLLFSAVFGLLALAAQSTEPPAACHVQDRPSAPLPDSHYLLTEAYGWFDTSHFNTGRPAQVLADVRAATAAGGAIITIDQGIHNDITGYTAAYDVAPGLSDEQAVAVALGIYLDWSRRFEAWQGEPPQGWLGPTSAFAVEDLPSQYLGFVAAAWDVEIGRLFDCYLGPVVADDDGPPDIVLDSQTAAPDGWAGLARLANRTFLPRVRDEAGWRYVNWPPALKLIPLPSGPDTWRYRAETTWFFADPAVDGPIVADPARPPALQTVR